ncbi:MAG: hypothetical protein OQK46_09060 [Gammaproteobacteria bacterium]|nr:hypothetical protein [Gammaproteobacteria bacterium]
MEVCTSKLIKNSASILLSVYLSSVYIAPSYAGFNDLQWICDDGDWGNQSCWNNAPFPAPGVTSFFLTQSDDIDRVATYQNIGFIPGGALEVFVDSTGTGTMTLFQSQNILNVSSVMSVGIDGTGMYSQDGGTLTAFNFLMGVNSGSNGFYNQTNGNLETANEVIGVNGTGTINQSGGIHTNTGRLTLGGQDGSIGNYTLSGTGELDVWTETIGGQGVGVFTQDGGSNSMVYLELGENGYGTYTLNEGTLTSSTEVFGSRINQSDITGAGYFIQNGGVHTVTDNLAISVGLGSEGSYTLTAGTLNANRVTIGYYNTGSFNQSGGDHIIDTDLIMGVASDGEGVYNLTGGNLTVNGSIQNLRSSGNSIINIEGGTLNANDINVDKLNVGSASGSTGNHVLTTGQTINATEIVIGSEGAGVFTQVDGNNTTTNITLASQGGDGTYNLQGGTLSAENIIAENSNSQFNFTGGNLAVDIFTGNLINNGGVLSPGSIASQSTTKIIGDYTQNLDGIFNVDFLYFNHDSLDVSGTAHLGGTLDVDILPEFNSFFLGDSFNILTAETIVGEFDLLSLALLDGDLNWDVNYILDDYGMDIVQLSVVSAVPIPAAVWLFSSGLIGLIGMARRKNHKPK